MAGIREAICSLPETMDSRYIFRFRQFFFGLAVVDEQKKKEKKKKASLMPLFCSSGHRMVFFHVHSLFAGRKGGIVMRWRPGLWAGR